MFYLQCSGNLNKNIVDVDHATISIFDFASTYFIMQKKSKKKNKNRENQDIRRTENMLIKTSTKLAIYIVWGIDTRYNQGNIPVDSQNRQKRKKKRDRNRKKEEEIRSMRNNPSTHPIKHKITLHSRVQPTNSRIDHPGGHAIRSQLVVLHSLVQLCVDSQVLGNLRRCPRRRTLLSDSHRGGNVCSGAIDERRALSPRVCARLFDRLEVADGFDLEFEGSVTVTDDERVLVQLQRRERPHVVHAAFETFLQRGGLVGACGDDDDFARFHDRLDTDCQGPPGDLVDVVVEEPGVCEDGVVGQGFDASAAAQGRPGLVECDVAVGADSAQEQLDATVASDARLKRRTLGAEVWGVPVEDVDVLGRDVDMREEFLVHEAVVRFGMVTGKTDILILSLSVWIRERESMGVSTMLKVTTFLKEMSPAR